ncbi:MAG: hypothetical protein R3B70_31150 [Polyangiaceae bacterium]
MRRATLRTAVFSIVISTAALLVSAGAARADVVGPPADNCPDGAVGQTCHGGPYCAPDICAANEECSEGEVCADTELCTGTIDCGGGGGPSPTTSVTGTCAAGCAAGSTCTTQKVCVPDPSKPDEVVVTGCACDLPGAGTTALGGSAALLFATALAGLRARRRKRR